MHHFLPSRNRSTIILITYGIVVVDDNATKKIKYRVINVEIT